MFIVFDTCHTFLNKSMMSGNNYLFDYEYDWFTSMKHWSQDYLYTYKCNSILER